MEAKDFMHGFEGENEPKKTKIKIGENAPRGVKMAIREWRRLPKKERDKKPLLYWLLGSGTPPYKMSKKDSNYIGKSVKGMNCGNCRYTFQRHVNEEYICSQIRGNVKLDHWCRLWVSGDTANPKPKK